jgi:hypothetical protein
MRLTPAEEALLRQVRTLPTDLFPLVSGLVDFLVKTEQERRQRETREAEQSRAEQVQLEGGPLGRVWDNADDAAYDRL